MSNTTTANNQTVKNNLLVVLGAAIIIGAFMGAIQVSSTNQQAGSLKSSVADKAITDTSAAKVNPGTGVGREKVFLIGGQDVYMSTDPNLSNWTLLSTLPYSNGGTEKLGHSVLYFNNKIWVLGGRNGINTTADVLSSPDGINWTIVTQNAPWGPRYEHTSVVFNNKMWVMGGAFNAGMNNNVWSSVDGLNWVQETSNANWSPRINTCTVAKDSKIFLIAGDKNGVFGGDGDVWSSSDGISWNQLNANIPPWDNANSHSCFVLNNEIYFLTRNTYNSAPSPDVWKSADGINWNLVNNLAPYGSRALTASFIFNNKMWVIGGLSLSNPGIHNDIWSSLTGVTWTQNSSPAPWAPTYFYEPVVVPATFGCLVRANWIPNTAQLNAGTHVKTYEFQVTTCANPVTLTQIDFNTSQTAGVKRTNIKLETNNTAIAIPQSPVYTAAVYPIFKPNYTVPAYTTQTFTVTEDIGGSIVTGSSISSNLMKMTANFGSNTISWTNTFPLGITTLTH